MKEDNKTKTKKQLIDELTELSSQNAALKKSMIGITSAELAAEEARRYAESIVETVREPLLVLDADLKIISANRIFYTTFKVTPGETIGSFIFDLGNKQWDIPGLRQLLEEVLPEKQAFDDFEVTHDFQDIGHKSMLLNACRIYRKDIGSNRILLAIEDITERKRLESLLIDSEQQYRRLFETASDGIVLLEKREGKIMHANPATEMLLGYTQKDIIGNKLQDIGILLDTSDFQTTMQNLNKSGILNYRNVKVETKSGQHLDTEIYLVDRAKLVQCNVRDISERKRAKEELRESEDRYRSLFANSIEAILLTAPDGKILVANPEACRIFERTEEEICRIDRAGLIDRTDPRLAPALEEHARTGQFRGELTFVRKNGASFPGEIFSVIFRDLDGNSKTSMSIRDITKRKQAEEKLKYTLESLKNALNTTIQVMVSAVEIRDPYTAGHQIRSADLARDIATEMGLPKEKIAGIRMAGSIHDIGKLSIPAEILSKPTKLSAIEFSLIKEHARQGYEMLKNVESPWPLAEIVHQHHERMDGSGYPRGLKGEEILIEARIIAVADVVEAMASHRPYRPALGIDLALAEIEKNRGVLYDDAAADACLKLFREKGFRLTEA